MSHAEKIVLIGAGQAAGTCASELRRHGYEGELTIVGDEAHIPYKRPPLSKAYFSGEMELAKLYVSQAAKLESSDIKTLTNTSVTQVNREAKTVSLSNGESLSYDKLLVATGGRPRPLPVPGADLPNVFLLRGIDDVDAIREQCGANKRMVIVGGGFIGLEVAASATKLGMKVTVLEGLPRVLARVTAPVVSEFFEKEHQKAGVDIRLGAAVEGIQQQGPALEVTLGDGSAVQADMVVIGIGLIANTELAESAGLEVDNGIAVNAHCQSSDPDIYAAGDCCSFPIAHYGRKVRLESVQNAMDQAKVVASSMLGEPKEYTALPWFWSDQFDLKLQMCGLNQGHDEVVVRGSPEERNFSVFYLQGGEIIAADTISRPKDFMMAKKLVAERVQSNATTLSDESIELKSLLDA